MFDLERDSAIDASIMALTALSVIAAPYHCNATLHTFRLENHDPFIIIFRNPLLLAMFLANAR